MAAKAGKNLTERTIKEQVRARDNYRCTKCGITQARHVEIYNRILDVHRLTPGSEYTVDGCVTLCQFCHGPQPKSSARSGQFTTALLPRDLVWDATLVARAQGISGQTYINRLLSTLVHEQYQLMRLDMGQAKDE